MPFLVLLASLVGCSSSERQSQPQDPPRPKLTNVYQVGPVVDLLAQVDLDRDVVNGEFRRDGESLIIPAVRAAQLNLDVDLPEQYLLTLDVAKTRGNESLNLGITVGGFQTSAVIEGWGKRISGLNQVDGRLGEDNVTSSTFPVFTDSGTKRIRVIVRRESVLIDVDNAVFIDFRGDPSRLSFDDRFFRRPRPSQLMLGSWDTEFRVTRWELTPFGDERETYTPRAVNPKAKAIAKAPVQPPTASDTGNAAAPSTDGSLSSSKVRWKTGKPEDKPPDTVEVETPKMEPVPWRAKPDTYPGWDGSAASEISVPAAKGWGVVPDGPSPYFLLGATTDEICEWAVHDVRTGNPVGSVVELPIGDHTHPKLCASGRYMRTYVGSAGARRVVIHSFVSGEPVYDAESPDVRICDAERDVLALNHNLLQVRGDRDHIAFQRVDLRTGQIEASWSDDRREGDLAAIAVSPGGRFVVANWIRQLSVCEFSTGDLVGQIDVPQGFEFHEALAFPIDGSELALLGRESGRSSPALWCIDWNSGETAFLGNVRAEILGLQNNYRLGPALEWFPNKELLLYYGRDVLDRRTGKFCYQIPNNVYWQNPRRTLGNRSLLGMMPGDDPDERFYRTVSIEEEPFIKALDVVRAGGIAEDVGLPELAVAGSSAGRVISAADNTGPVALTPEARPVFPESSVSLPLRLALFRDDDTELRRIEFADPPEAVAVIHFTLDKNGNKERQDVVVRFDLQRGKGTSTIPIRRDFRLAAVSPDGTLALLGLFNEVDGYSRLDVVDLVGRQHVAGWRPYHEERYVEDKSTTGQPEARNPMTATWVRFLDNAHVLTVNPMGKLVCWQVPECKAVFTCNDLGKPLALSANRRYVTCSKDTHLELLDVHNGTWAGKLEPEEVPQTILRAGFASDHGQLATVLGYQGRRRLVVWDLTNGNPTESFDLPYHTVSPGWSEHAHAMHRQLGLEFRRDGFLTLDDLHLVDRAGKSVPWSYSLRRGKHVVNGPDGREWFTHFQTGNDRGQTFEFWLSAADMPSDKVIKMIRTATDSNSEHPVGQSVLSLIGEDAQLTL
jgi:hypothetical protein